MTRIADIKDVIPYLKDHSDDMDITIGEVTVIDGLDVIDELELQHYELSFVSHRPKEDDGEIFIKTWLLYRSRHYDEWVRIYNDLQLINSTEYDPTLSYFEKKTITPNIQTASSQAYDRLSAVSGTNADTTTHGTETTTQANTYDGELRDAAKSTTEDTDSHLYSTSGTDSSKGMDTAVSTTTGNTTEHREGSRDNPLVNLQTDIDFAARNNLRDLIIMGFIKECLFYNNDNREVNRYGFYY